ncbi:L-serine ammonia-lyase, iron-sulfur-dependent, subunit beta [Candidatus Peregrinibacteria bacterium]|nr:L-serine ammonia-lyase, iron-sulfur-dependent, subunit beta [Candidatus Peregrinibacteria bacterium]
MRDTWSIFDVIGPVMMGPSSSHTAGACKLGYMAGIIFGKKPTKCVLRLHGSFGEVYQGHRTDVALVGGILGMLPSDTNLKDAFKKAKAAHIEIEVVPTNLGNGFHPNTVDFVLYSGNDRMRIIGSSLGGGKVVISEIDKVNVSLTGSYSSLLICYDNTKFNLSHIMKYAAEQNITIVKMETTQYKDRSLIDIEIREQFETPIVHEIEVFEGVHWARFVNHISHFTEVGL